LLENTPVTLNALCSEEVGSEAGVDDSEERSSVRRAGLKLRFKVSVSKDEVKWFKRTYHNLGKDLKDR
jgi:hypothetical protein